MFLAVRGRRAMTRSGRIRLGAPRAPGRRRPPRHPTTPCWRRSSTWSARCVLAWGDVSDAPPTPPREAASSPPTPGRVDSTPRRCSPARARAACPSSRSWRSCARRPRPLTRARAGACTTARPARTSSTPASCWSRGACSTPCAGALLARARASTRSPGRSGRRVSIARTLGQHAERDHGRRARRRAGSTRSRARSRSSTRLPSRCSSAAPSAPGTPSTSGSPA